MGGYNNPVEHKRTKTRFVPDVLEENIQRLQQLHVDRPACLLLHDRQEMRPHLALQEEAKHRVFR